MVQGFETQTSKTQAFSKVLCQNLEKLNVFACRFQNLLFYIVFLHFSEINCRQYEENCTQTANSHRFSPILMNKSQRVQGKSTPNLKNSKVFAYCRQKTAEISYRARLPRCSNCYWKVSCQGLQVIRRPRH